MYNTTLYLVFARIFATQPVKVLAADKGDDSKDKRAALRKRGIRPQWPKRVWKTKKNRGRPIKISVPRFQQGPKVAKLYPSAMRSLERLISKESS